MCQRWLKHSRATVFAQQLASTFFHVVVKAFARYQKVFDDRKRRIRSLWKRNDHFYSRLVFDDEIAGHKTTKRVRFGKSPHRHAEARTALRDL